MIFMKLDTNNSFFWGPFGSDYCQQKQLPHLFSLHSHLLDLAKSEIRRLKIKANGKTKTDNKKLNQI